jgi:hypothetical protein
MVAYTVSEGSAKRSPATAESLHVAGRPGAFD